jgi:HSP20 family molecular chaperone IbpA
MFNLKNKKDMLLDKLFHEPFHVWSTENFEKPSFTSLATPFTQYYTEKDGETIKVFVNCVGHNPKDIELDATEDEIQRKGFREYRGNRKTHRCYTRNDGRETTCKPTKSNYLSKRN